MKIYESGEDYLEMILMLQEQKGVVRSVDIASALGYSKPSVSVAMKHLRENGYVAVDGNGHITLLEPGLAIARRIYDRHRKLTDFLMALGVSEETAQRDACKIEHDLSDETYEKLVAHAMQHPALRKEG